MQKIPSGIYKNNFIFLHSSLFLKNLPFKVNIKIYYIFFLFWVVPGIAKTLGAKNKYFVQWLYTLEKFATDKLGKLVNDIILIK